MRWRANIKFAWKPTYCDCGHVVWLEKYTYCGDRQLLVSSFPIYKCKKCKPIKREGENEQGSN